MTVEMLDNGEIFVVTLPRRTAVDLAYGNSSDRVEQLLAGLRHKLTEDRPVDWESPPGTRPQAPRRDIGAEMIDDLPEIRANRRLFSNWGCEGW